MRTRRIPSSVRTMRRYVRWLIRNHGENHTEAQEIAADADFSALRSPENCARIRHWDRVFHSSRQAGFTLIELMITIAIIAILAAIAFPAYQSYVIRAQVTEGLQLASQVKNAVAESYAITGRFPDNAQDAGLDPAALPSGRYVQSVDVRGGLIVITFGPLAHTGLSETDRNVLAIAPGESSGGQVVWQCGTAPQTGDSVRWAGDAASVTTVKANLLPKDCK